MPIFKMKIVKTAHGNYIIINEPYVYGQCYLATLLIVKQTILAFSNHPGDMILDILLP